MTSNEKLDQKRLKLLFERHLWPSLFSIPMGMVAFSFVYQSPSRTQILWPIFQSLISLARFFMCKKCMQSKKENIKNCEIAYSVMSFIHGLLWGITPIIFNIPFKYEHGLMILLPFFMITSFMTSSGHSKLIAISFAIPTASICLLFLIFSVDNIQSQIAIATAGLIFIALIIRSIEVTFKRSNQNLVLNIERGVLIDELEQKLDLEKQIKEEREKTFHQSRLASLGQMSAGVAHEINNPLAIIKGAARIIARQVEDNQDRPGKIIEDCCEKINRTVDRIAFITRGLRAFDGSDVDTDFENQSLKTLFEDTYSLCRDRFKARGIKFEMELPQENQKAHYNKVQMTHVLANLLNNSFDAVTSKDEDRWIKLAIKEDNDFFKISVEDSGPGIKTEHLNRIMEPFFSTRPKGERIGLGLSVASGIIDIHGGQLTLDRQCPHTRFVISLPKLIAKKSVA